MQKARGTTPGLDPMNDALHSSTHPIPILRLHPMNWFSLVFTNNQLAARQKEG
jgi:hypothetical protein